MAIQGSSPNLQGGTLSLQGSTYNPQPAAGISIYQPAAGQSALDRAGAVISSGQKALAAPSPINAGLDQATKDLLAKYSSQLAAANQKVYAPKLDIGSLNAQARAAAESAVNPYYTKQLNDFLAQQATQRQQEQQQTEMNIQNLQDTLKNTLEANKISQGRTAEDVAQNQQNINTAADQFQTDTGQAYDAARLALAKGTSTGGLGQQQQETAQTTRNTQEKRQQEQFQQQLQQQEQLKGRTFEDLARSGTLATQAETKGEKQAQFDLSKFLTSQEAQLSSQKQTLEAQRLSQLAQETQNQSKLAFNRYLAGIANPAQYQAAVQTYGGFF